MLHKESINKVVIKRPRTRSFAKKIGETKSLEPATSKGISMQVVRDKGKKVLAEQSQQMVISKEK